MTVLIEPLHSALRVLAEHATWTRDPRWLQQWFEEFLNPLYAEGLFVPPLLAFELRSAAERGERRMGKFLASRAYPLKWREFALWIHSLTVVQLSPGAAARKEMRTESALRIARCLALNLMAQVDVSVFRTDRAFDAKSAVLLEARRLEGDPSAVQQFSAVWSIIDETVRTGRFSDLVPFCRSRSTSQQRTLAIDPFLAKLLKVSEAKRSKVSEPPVQGRILQADSLRKSLAATGEFARRDLGGLPGNLGRLAPTELLLLHEAFGTTAPSRPPTDSNGFRTLFLMRASQSGLLQRFQYDTETANTEPSVCILIELNDDPHDHRLSDATRPPVVSYYRALLVHLFHQFSLIAEEFQWNTRVSLVHNASNSRHQIDLNPAEIQELRESPPQAADYLISNCPTAFVAARFHSPALRVQSTTLTSSFDLIIRIVIGRETPVEQEQQQSHLLRTRKERGMRVECLAGNWGWASSDDCASASGLAVQHFSKDTEDCSLLAMELIQETLGVKPADPELEIE